jgi:hypothetical protein
VNWINLAYIATVMEFYENSEDSSGSIKSEFIGQLNILAQRRLRTVVLPLRGCRLLETAMFHLHGLGIASKYLGKT